MIPPGPLFPIGWYCFLAPARLPQPIATGPQAEAKAVLDDSGMAKKLDSMDIVVNWAEGANFLAGMKTDMGRWAERVERCGPAFDQ